MIFKVRKRLAAAFAALTLPLICGCGGFTQEVTETCETEEPVPVMAQTSEEPEPEPYPVTVNGVVIEGAPKRVVSLSPSLTEIICEMGYGGSIAGRGSYCDYPPEIASLTDAGRPAKPDFDTIISLSPEIVFTATSIPAKDVYRLEEHGIKTVYISYPRSIAEFESIYNAVGYVYEGLFDGEKKGAEGFSRVRAALDKKPELGRFVYITEGLSIATGDTFESSVLSCFGTNVGANGEDYSFPREALLEDQPDVVLLSSVYTADDLTADEVYSQLDAVVNGKIIIIDNSYFERPSARISGLIDLLIQQ